MGRRNLPVEEESDSGAPEWMVTFSDCMTLLLTFFVLLLSFSSFDNKEFKKLKVIYSTALNSIYHTRLSDRDALNYVPQIEHTTEIDKGSEKPTNTEGSNSGLLKEQPSDDLDNGMVFLIPSKDLFWGNGPLISSDGNEILNDMAEFLNKIPNRIVISEKGANNNQDDESLGLSRAWAVVYYFTSKHNISKDRFSISITGTLNDSNNRSTNQASDQYISEREIEISLLERSIYN